MNYKTMPIFLAFLIMGVADAMGPMGDAVKNQYQLSNVMATMLAFFVFIAFAVFSVPGGLLAARIGKKKLLLLGLGLNALAMLIPSIMEPGFGLLLGCIFVLGIGTTFLQVAGNPIMRDVSKEGNYSRNLSFAQGIKGLGSTVATYLVTAITAIALFQNMGWRGVFPLFFLLMAVAFVWVAFLKIDEAKPDVPPSIGSSLSLLKKPVFAMAVLGIFLYVGAESCMGRFLFPQMRSVFHEKYEVSATPEDVDAAIAAEILLADAKDTAGANATADANEIALAQGDLNKVDSDQLERAKTALAKATQYGAAMFFLLLTIGRIAGGVVLNKVKPRPAFR
ncbi:MAG: sugar MFS transporter, partial [Planctomycetes bacterium]|nr:sugar MFS transporter [Planctomycetota bacterium]